MGGAVVFLTMGGSNPEPTDSRSTSQENDAFTARAEAPVFPENGVDTSALQPAWQEPKWPTSEEWVQENVVYPTYGMWNTAHALWEDVRLALKENRTEDALDALERMQAANFSVGWTGGDLDLQHPYWHVFALSHLSNQHLERVVAQAKECLTGEKADSCTSSSESLAKMEGSVRFLHDVEMNGMQIPLPCEDKQVCSALGSYHAVLPDSDGIPGIHEPCPFLLGGCDENGVPLSALPEPDNYNSDGDGVPDRLDPHP